MNSDEIKKAFQAIEEIQRLGYRILMRRGLMLGVAGGIVQSTAELRVLGRASVVHEHARLAAESEEGLSERGAKRVAQILRHGIPAGAQPMLAAPPQPGQAALPAYSGEELDETTDDGALAQRIENVTSMVQHLLQRTGDPGDEYEEVAAFAGRKL